MLLPYFRDTRAPKWGRPPKLSGNKDRKEEFLPCRSVVSCVLGLIPKVERGISLDLAILNRHRRKEELMTAARPARR